MKTINLNGLSFKNEFHQLLEKHKPQKVRALTWGLNPLFDISYFTGKKKLHLGVAYFHDNLDVLVESLNAHPNVSCRRIYVHSKIWIFDKHVYVGSTNLSSEALGNVMIKVTGAKANFLTEYCLKAMLNVRQSGTVIL